MDWGLFKRAVADTEDPISGCMYREMAQWTFKDHNTQTKLINALFEKLKLNSGVHVLFKVLRIIKVMCELGHCEFQKEMQRNSYIEIIKGFVNYSGAQDVRHGDKLNEKVRQAAREAIEIIFTHCKDDKLTIQAGHGNKSVEQPNKPGFITSSTVIGRETFLGEPTGLYGGRVAPMPATNKWAEHMKEEAAAAKTSTATRVLSALAEKAKNGLGIVTSSSDLQKTFKTAKDQLHENVLKLSSAEPNSRLLLAANAGSFQPVELAPDTSLSARVEANSAASSSWKFIEEINNGGCVAEPHKAASCAGGVVGFFQQEEQHQHQQQQQVLYVTPFQDLVQRLCQTRDTPQRVELSAFVAQCHRLGSEMIERRGAAGRDDAEDDWDCWEELSEAIDAQLAQKQPWQRRLNALAALEALLTVHAEDTATMAAMRRAVMQYFLENPEDVQRNVLVVQATLRERAQRIVRMLGLPDVKPAGDKSDWQPGEVSPPVMEEQLRGTTNSMNTFSSLLRLSSAPPAAKALCSGGGGGDNNVLSSSTANMGGMMLRANHRGMKDKTKLKKRAPMRLDTEPHDHAMENDNCCRSLNDRNVDDKSKKSLFFLDSATAAASARKFGAEKSATGGGADLLDVIFAETPVPSSAGAPLAPVVAAASSSSLVTKPSVSTPEPNLLFHKNNTVAFDFLTSGAGTDCAPVAASGQQESLFSSAPADLLFPQPQQEQFVTPHMSSSSLAGGDLLFFGNTTTPTAERSAGDKGDEKNCAEAVKSSFSSLCPTKSASATTATKSLPSMILEVQQHMQSLMVSLQRKNDPDALAQLQALAAQQQQLVRLLSGQQGRQEEAPLQACWAVPSTGAACGPDADTVPFHSHFKMGAASSTSSSCLLSSAALNAFADMQQEMMAKCPASNPHQ